MLLNSDLGFVGFLPRLLTQSAADAQAPASIAVSLRPDTGTGHDDWKVSTLAVLHRQRAAVQPDQSADPGADAEKALESPAAAAEAAAFTRNEILHQVTTALRAQVNVSQLPLQLLTMDQMYAGLKEPK